MGGKLHDAIQKGVDSMFAGNPSADPYLIGISYGILNSAIAFVDGIYELLRYLTVNIDEIDELFTGLWDVLTMLFDPDEMIELFGNMIKSSINSLGERALNLNSYQLTDFENAIMNSGNSDWIYFLMKYGCDSPNDIPEEDIPVGIARSDIDFGDFSDFFTKFSLGYAFGWVLMTALEVAEAVYGIIEAGPAILAGLTRLVNTFRNLGSKMLKWLLNPSWSAIARPMLTAIAKTQIAVGNLAVKLYDEIANVASKISDNVMDLHLKRMMSGQMLMTVGNGAMDIMVDLAKKLGEAITDPLVREGAERLKRAMGSTDEALSFVDDLGSHRVNVVKGVGKGVLSNVDADTMTDLKKYIELVDQAGYANPIDATDMHELLRMFDADGVDTIIRNADDVPVGQVDDAVVYKRGYHQKVNGEWKGFGDEHLFGARDNGLSRADDLMAKFPDLETPDDVINRIEDIVRRGKLDSDGNFVRYYPDYNGDLIPVKVTIADDSPGSIGTVIINP
ncbi:MAG: hypothetical protein KAS32_06315, partial [Candidatus Peribacteraceae bacterium]|nr:hypothetical protein [Candidatus Peribacteraceae bacterium]